MNTEEFSSRVKEKFNAEVIEEITLDDEKQITLFYLEVVDHKVVCGVYTDLIFEGGSVNLSACTRFSICSNQDVYDEEVGKSLAIGRLIGAETFDFSTTMDKGKYGPDKLRRVIDGLVTDRIAALENTLESRAETLKYMRSREQDIYSQLGEELQEFK